MKRYFRYLFLIVASIFISFFSYSQNWTRQPLKAKKDSIFAIYAWEAHDQFHAAGGEIALTKKGRFQYHSFRPLNYQQHSEGTYQIKKDTLILTSDLQTDNLKVNISYIDSIGHDTMYTRLRFPVNKKGDTLYRTYYYLNDDTSFNGQYDPSFNSDLASRTTIRSLKLMFYDTNWGSAWILVTQPNKYLKVTLLTDVNADDQNYKVIKNWKFKMIGSQLKPLFKDQ